MTKKRVIAIVAFNGFQILDVSGPASVFSSANDALNKKVYQVIFLSAQGGMIKSSSGLEIKTIALRNIENIDTLLIAGGDEYGIDELIKDKTATNLIKKNTLKAKRYGSICTGAYVLGRLGLLNGKRITTHWNYCEKLAKEVPTAVVDSNALYVNDKRVWTSAGVTTGIDMSLQIVANDYGNLISNQIAQRLVLYARRPGYQSQFSPVLTAQSNAEPFIELVNWIKENISKHIDAEVMAKIAEMSHRNFYRKFVDSFGVTPAQYVKSVRIDMAKDMLSTNTPLKTIAKLTGFTSVSQLTRVFETLNGISPNLFRQLNQH